MKKLIFILALILPLSAHAVGFSCGKNNRPYDISHHHTITLGNTVYYCDRGNRCMSLKDMKRECAKPVECEGSQIKCALKKQGKK